MLRAFASRLRCVSSTPLGAPVVPEVYISSAVVGGIRCARVARARSACARRVVAHRGSRASTARVMSRQRGRHRRSVAPPRSRASVPSRATRRSPATIVSCVSSRDEDHARIRMLDDIAHLRRLAQQIQRIGDKPAVHRREQQARGLDAVAHEDGHDIARTQARRLETCFERDGSRRAMRRTSARRRARSGSRNGLSGARCARASIKRVSRRIERHRDQTQRFDRQRAHRPTLAEVVAESSSDFRHALRDRVRDARDVQVVAVAEIAGEIVAAPRAAAHRERERQAVVEVAAGREAVRLIRRSRARPAIACRA